MKLNHSLAWKLSLSQIIVTRKFEIDKDKNSKFESFSNIYIFTKLKVKSSG